MAENERDPKLSQRYRSLGAEEPPRALDEAILAASRRAAETRPAPLVAPTGRRRWYFPLAAAAVIVLSVAVTWHMQRAERPAPDGVALSESKPLQADAAREAPASAAPKQEIPARAGRVEPRAAEPPAPASAAPAEERLAAEGMRSRADAKPAPQAGAMLRKAMRDEASVETPEKQLERIAELRQAGKHDEADKLLAEFRKRFPDYRISEEMLGKVEKK